MYEKKLKSDLFEKIKRMNELQDELNNIDSRGDDYNEKSSKGQANDTEIGNLIDEYECVSVQICDLRDEIDESLLNTRFFPLVGLQNSEIKPIKQYVKTLNLNYAQVVDNFLNKKLQEMREDMKSRLKKIKFHTLPGAINPRVYFLYNQIVKSYVFGNFESTIVLSRAISEGIAKRYIKAKGYEKLLVGKNIGEKVMTIPGILKKELDLPNDLLRLHRLIEEKANRVLHELDEVTEEKDALNSIKNLNLFLKKFPKSI